MKSNTEVIQSLRGGLIVSCQALPEEPLHSSYIMGRMAYAAQEGGAAGIRANTVEDITEIRTRTNLPVIGIIKAVYADSDVYITPTMKEVDALATMPKHPEIIALDATNRLRPGSVTLDDFFPQVRAKYPGQLFMADCSNVEEGLHAAKLGFDLVGTTLSGYTPYTKGTPLPNFEMMRVLAQQAGVPVIAEGGIWSPDQLMEAYRAGVTSAVVGTAITRPREITHRFVAALKANG